MSTALIPAETIEKRILLIRGKKVMIDTDLAKLYEVQTKEKKDIGLPLLATIASKHSIQLTQIKSSSINF